jgi:surface antigen
MMLEALEPTPEPGWALSDDRRDCVDDGLGVQPHRMGRGDAQDGEESCMQPRSLRCLLAALAGCFILSAAAQAQVMPFRGTLGPGLSPQDSQLLFESIARLNEAEPAKVGRSEAWSNPQTSSSGTSTILRVFHSGGMVCHRLRHHIVIAGQELSHDYHLTWCRTSTGEWKSKG